MNEPTPPSDDVLDFLHEEGRRAAESATFDVERMLDVVRHRAASFWESLDLEAQNKFGAKARPRTFAAGALLMEEGETADYVLVILEGWAAVSARNRDGIQQVVAERGPGELVGEHAIERAGKRSATVVARTQVRVLDMKAADFAEFLRMHPSVPRPRPRPT